MKDTLLVELRCEELPPSLLYQLAHDFSCILASNLQEAGLIDNQLDYQQAKAEFNGGHEKADYNKRMLTDWGMQNYATPRRLAVLVNDVLAKTKVKKHVRRGPVVGANEKAISGFLKANKIKKNQLSRMTYRDKEYYAYESKIPSVAITKVIGKVIESTINNISAPRMMGWADNDWLFVRPINGWCIVHGKKEVKANIFDLASTGKTIGHNYLATQQIDIAKIGVAKYVSVLARNYVLVDPWQRRERIAKQLEILKKKELKGHVVELDLDNDENVRICEWPTPYVANFNIKFLELPNIVINHCAKKHLRSYTVKNKGKIAPKIIFIADNDFSVKLSKQKRISDQHISGVERVIQARFDDSYFLFKQDLKLNFNQLQKNMHGITYLEIFGSLYERSRRLAALIYIAKISINTPDTLFLEPELMVDIIQAIANKAILTKEEISFHSLLLIKVDAEEDEFAKNAKYCQYDVGTNLHDEYPELEGQLASIYLEKLGKINKNVANCISEFKKTAMNSTSVDLDSLILADEIERICAYAILDMLPKGSGDPYGIRQSAIRIITIAKKYPKLIIFNLIRSALYLLLNDVSNCSVKINNKDLENAILNFLFYRCENIAISTYKKTDFEVNARIRNGVIARYIDEIHHDFPYDPKFSIIKFYRIRIAEILLRIDGLSRLVASNARVVEKILELHKRISNILIEPAQDMPTDFSPIGELELRLYKTIQLLHQDYIKIKVNDITSEDCSKYLLRAFMLLSPVIEDFLDQLRINVSDPKIMKRRSYLLSVSLTYLNGIADLRHLYS